MNPSVRVGKQRAYPWQVAKTTGNHFMWLPGRRVITVITRFGKWNYGVQLPGDKKLWRNGFETEADAMRAAEEEFGDQVVDVGQPALRPVVDLRVVPKTEIEQEVVVEKQVIEKTIELEVQHTPQVTNKNTELEVQHEEPARTPSARTQDEYVKAMCEEGPTAWHKVFYHSCGDRKSLAGVAARSGLPLDETIRMLRTAYDPKMVDITIESDSVKLRLKYEDSSLDEE